MILNKIEDDPFDQSTVLYFGPSRFIRNETWNHMLISIVKHFVKFKTI